MSEENKSYFKETFAIFDDKNFVLMTTMKNIMKCETTVITLKNIGTLLIIFATDDTKYQKKFLWYFIMVLNMAIILQSKSWQKNLKDSLNA